MNDLDIQGHFEVILVIKCTAFPHNLVCLVTFKQIKAVLPYAQNNVSWWVNTLYSTQMILILILRVILYLYTGS